MPSALCVYLLLACLVILIMQTRARTVNRSLRDQPTAVNRPAASQKATVAKPAAAQKAAAAKPVVTEAAKPGIVIHKVAKPASTAAQKAPRPSAVPKPQAAAKPPAAAKPSAATTAAAAAPAASAGTYVRAPVPKAIKQIVPRTARKPAPPKRFVAPYNPYENMSKDGFHCVRCHRDINVGNEKHYFCLIPHVFERSAWEAVAKKYEGLGGDRALKFGKIREIPVTAPACCTDAQLNARGQVELGGVDLHNMGFHTPFPEEVEQEIKDLHALKRPMPQLCKCLLVDGKCTKECLRPRYPHAIFTDEI